MDIDAVTASAQEHLRATDVDGWLLYDYRGMNPIFWDTVGAIDKRHPPLLALGSQPRATWSSS